MHLRKNSVTPYLSCFWLLAREPTDTRRLLSCPVLSSLVHNDDDHCDHEDKGARVGRVVTALLFGWRVRGIDSRRVSLLRRSISDVACLRAHMADDLGRRSLLGRQKIDPMRSHPLWSGCGLCFHVCQVESQHPG